MSLRDVLTRKRSGQQPFDPVRMAAENKESIISVSLLLYLSAYLVLGMGGISFPFQLAAAEKYTQTNVVAPSGALWIEETNLHWTNGTHEFSLNQTASLVADWHMDDGTGQNASDLHSILEDRDGRRGETSGSETKDPDWVAGKSSNALNWSGNDQVLTTPVVESGTSLHADQGFTVAAWVKWVKGASANWPRIVNADCSENWCLIVDNGGNDGGQDVRWSAQFDGGQEIIYTSSSINDGNWHHLAGVYDPAVPEIRVYFDGVEEASGSTNVDSAGTGTGTSRTVHVGCGSESASYPGTCQGTAGATEFVGSIDEVKLFDRALSTAAIKELYQGGGTDPGGGGPGAIWVEGDTFRWIDANGYEQVYNGSVVTTSPSGPPGAVWIESGDLHYIDQDGHERFTDH